jgi:hemerythrin
MRHPHIPNISVGNRVIDSEYKKMFDIIHRIQCSIKAKDCAVIAADFKLLEDSARACFSVEEEIARAVGFDFTLHNLAHQNLLKEYQLLADELASRNGTWSDGEGEVYKSLLNNRLIKHLEYESRPLRIVLDTYLYDFKPT